MIDTKPGRYFKATINGQGKDAQSAEFQIARSIKASKKPNRGTNKQIKRQQPQVTAAIEKFLAE